MEVFVDPDGAFSFVPVPFLISSKLNCHPRFGVHSEKVFEFDKDFDFERVLCSNRFPRDKALDTDNALCFSRFGS